MSVERRERRRCDICGELITGAYYSCSRKNLMECPTPNPGYWITQGQGPLGDFSIPLGNIGVIGTPYQPVTRPDLDVCPDCWDKMQEVG